jgi:hypothetical protein
MVSCRAETWPGGPWKHSGDLIKSHRYLCLGMKSASIWFAVTSWPVLKVALLGHAMQDTIGS